MIEALAVLLGVGVLALLAALVPLVPAEWWVSAGAQATALGLLVGVPSGLVYHWRLARALGARDALPRRWWLRPVSLHPELAPRERAGVLAWFYVGGAGFLLVVLGCAGVALGVLVEAFRAGVF